MKRRASGFGACLLGCLAFSQAAPGSTARIVLPQDPALNPFVIQGEPAIKVFTDGDPGTKEYVVFEVVVDSSTAASVWGFEWQFSVDGGGVGFDPTASEAFTAAMIGDAAWDPQYLLFGDSFSFDAAASAKGIRGSDVSDSLATYDSAGKSLGLFAVELTDEAGALGVHTVRDPDSFLLVDTDLNQEGVDVAPVQFEVVPEPHTIALLGVALLAFRRRRT